MKFNKNQVQNTVSGMSKAHGSIRLEQCLECHVIENTAFLVKKLP